MVNEVEHVGRGDRRVEPERRGVSDIVCALFTRAASRLGAYVDAALAQVEATDAEMRVLGGEMQREEAESAADVENLAGRRRVRPISSRNRSRRIMKRIVR